jgi:lipid A disaccharide synthetase
MVELLQENMTASSVRNELKMLLFDDSKRAEIEKRLSMIADFLRQDGDSITKIVRFLV